MTVECGLKSIEYTTTTTTIILSYKEPIGRCAIHRITLHLVIPPMPEVAFS